MKVILKIDPLNQHNATHLPKQITFEMPFTATTEQIMRRARQIVKERGLMGVLVEVRDEEGRLIGVLGTVEL